MRRIICSGLEVWWLEWIMLIFVVLKFLKLLFFGIRHCYRFKYLIWIFYRNSFKVQDWFKWLETSNLSRFMVWSFCGIHDLWFQSLHFPVVFQVCLKILWSMQYLSFRPFLYIQVLYQLRDTRNVIDTSPSKLPTIFSLLQDSKEVCKYKVWMCCANSYKLCDS